MIEYIKQDKTMDYNQDKTQELGHKVIHSGTAKKGES